MRNNKLNYVAVGTFVLTMVIGIMAAVTILSGGPGPTNTYYTTYQDATGLKYGTQVLYMGYPVGQVESIRPVQTAAGLSFELELSITEEFNSWKVPVDSVAQVKAAGLLAAITIDIRAGSSSDTLAPGGTFKGVEQADVFGAVSETASVIKTITESELKPLISGLNRSVQTLSSAIEADAAPLLANLNRVAVQLADRGPQIIGSFLATADELRVTSESLGRVLSDDNAERAEQFMLGLVDTSRNLSALSTDVQVYLKALVGPDIANRLRLVLEHSGAAAAELNALVAHSRQQVGTVLTDRNVATVSTLLASLDESGERLSKMIVRLSQQVQRLLDDRNISHVESGISRLDEAAQQTVELIANTKVQLDALLGQKLTGQVDAIGSNLVSASGDIAVVSGVVKQNIGAIVGPEIRAEIHDTIGNVNLASKDISALAHDSRQRLNTVLSPVNVERIDTMLASLESTTVSVSSTADLVRNRVGQMLDQENIDYVNRAMKEIDRAAGEVAALATQLKQDLNGLLGPATVTRFNQALENVSVLSENLNGSVGEVFNAETARELRMALGHFSTAAGNFAGLTKDLHETRQQFDALIAIVDGSVRDNRPGVDEALNDLRFTLRTVAQHISVLSSNLEGTSRNMYEFSRQIRNDPGVLLRGASPEAQSAASQLQ